jgi:hypothetical protein
MNGKNFKIEEKFKIIVKIKINYFIKAPILMDIKKIFQNNLVKFITEKIL